MTKHVEIVNVDGFVLRGYLELPENAKKIMATNPSYLIGSPWEGGYVYAWRFMPNEYAALNSGAHLGAIISFKTTTPFVKDPGITDPLVQVCGPVVSVIPGPVAVWDVQLVVTR